MKLLVLGATGATGRHVVRLARAAHAVTVLVRDPAKAGFDGDVRVVQGDAYQPETIKAAVPGHDAVISCLGAALSKSFGAGGKPGAAAAPALVEAMQASGVRRLVVMSALGAVDRSAVTKPFRMAMATMLSGIFADKDAMEPIIQAAPLDWTIVRAANLNNGPEGPVDDEPKLPLGLRSFVARASVAAYMVSILDRAATFRRIVYVTNRG